MKSTLHTTLLSVIGMSFGAAALWTVSMSASAVSAASDQDRRTETVHFDDLDLSKPAAAKILYSRIRGAARDVCEYSMNGDWLEREIGHACIEKAIDNAVKKVNTPALTALRFGSDVRLASK